MIENRAKQKKFRVRLTKRELELLLKATDIYGRRLVKQYTLNEEAIRDSVQQCPIEANRTPESAHKLKTLIDENLSIEAKIRQLESLETELGALLRGKNRGRRPNTPFYSQRLWNIDVLHEVRDQIILDRFIRKLLQEAKSSGRTE